MSKRERLAQSQRRIGNRKIGVFSQRTSEAFRSMHDKSAQATGLSPEKVILEKEDDLALLQRNEQEYNGAVVQNKLILTIMTMAKNWWGLSNEGLVSAWYIFKTGNVEREAIHDVARDIVQGRTNVDLRKLDPEQLRLYAVHFDRLKKMPRFYKDDYDEIIAGILSEENSSESVVDLVSEEVRSQSETLALLRLQIEYLKREKKEEKKRLRVQSRQKEVGLGKREITVQTPASNVEEVPQEQVSEVLELRPFGLSDWRVYWTEVKFSDNPNHLVAVPTDSEEAFESRLEEINAGRRAFQIKTRSVASCVEMWALPEFRQRALLSRFRWGPDYVRDWVKLVRGPVRIMVNSNEGEKKLIFFAADRDTVYRGVFAGMSS